MKSSSPRDYWGIIGHTKAIESLERAVAGGRLSREILLTGPHGIGKTTLAIALATRLQCTGPDPPCRQCRACVKNSKHASPDLRIVEGMPPGWDFDKQGYASPPRKSDLEKRTLRIDQIRSDKPDIMTVKDWLVRAPYESTYKIVILRRFEEANENAANAFLKTLEEPPDHAFIVLTAQDEGLLLPTIVSRCQKLALRPLRLQDVENALIEKYGAEPGTARLVARVSGGRVGWAIRALSDSQHLERRNAALDGLISMLQEGRTERMLRAAALAKEKEELPELLEQWLSWWRDLLLIQTGGSDRITNLDYASILTSQADKYPHRQVNGMLQATRAVQRQLDQNVNAQLAMEVLALDLPQ